MSTKKKLSLTTGTSLLFQLLSLCTGFILPKLILLNYGTKVNGLVVSITQFLSLISFLDMGVGQVVQSNLYQPLAEKNYSQVSDILVSAKKFFQTLAKVFLIYVIGLSLSYYFIIDNQFDFWYVSSLVIILSINSFAQYYFGIPYQLLLNSDQKGYVQCSIQIITLILNLGVSIILLQLGQPIHLVKASTSAIYLIRPFVLYLYVKKTYTEINLKKKIDYEPINQKWNGFAQHIASVVLNNTDSVILTLFSTLESVSIYSVYNMVISGVKNLFTSLMTGIQPVLGEMWAKKEIKKLKDFFGLIEWLIHTGTIIVFGCTCLLIIPFVKVYTEGISDANYININFAIILTVAHAIHCLRLPYNLMILACGHFKQTQSCYFIAAIINVITSIIGVYLFGLMGVAIGTLVAMLYQTVWLILYNKNNLLKWDIKIVLKQIMVDVLIVLSAVVVTNDFVNYEVQNYFEWFCMAIICVFIWLMVSLVINIVFNKQYVTNMNKVFKKNK